MIEKKELIRQQGCLLGLLVSMAVIFLLQLLLGQEWYLYLATIPGEVSASWRNLQGGDFGGRDFRVFFTLLSSAFLHGGVEHLLFNAIFLWIFAALTTELLGQRWMVLIFSVSAIAGSLAHTLLNTEEFIPMIGASGAVMGFMGAYLGMAVRWQLPDPHIWPMARPVPPANLAILAIIGITMDFIGLMDHEQTGIAYGAHVGGFLAGMFLTSFIVPSASVRIDRR